MIPSHGVVSLLEMLDFYADTFVHALTQFGAFELRLGEEAQKLIKPHILNQLYAEIAGLGSDCVLHGFKSSAQQCGRIVESMERAGKTLTCGQVRDELRDLRKRFEDDIKSELFLHLSLEEAELYRFPAKEWQKVIERFPKVQIDVEEGAKCFALNRYAASLFHVLLAAEYGVIELATLLGVAGDRPGWGSLERLEKITAKPYSSRSALEQEHSKLLESVIPFAHSIKNQWRHKINHVDNKLVWIDTDFSPQMARDIISAVRGFMDKLASDLPK